jgi:release factor glutamine methyltransferase
VSAPPDDPALVARLRTAGCVFAEDEARLLHEAAAEGRPLGELVERRIGGEPLEHLLGRVDFCGLRLAVEPGVFVPRSRTALLVEHALRALPERGSPRPVAVDLCCGCGAVGAALLAARPETDLHAADVDPAAVACARVNVARVGGSVHQGDLYAALPAGLQGRVEVLLANVPYVPTEAIALMPPEARLFEPRVALDGGADGLDVARRVTAAALEWLAPGGCLLFETGEEQSTTAVGIATAAGLRARVAADDERGATVVLATRP